MIGTDYSPQRGFVFFCILVPSRGTWASLPLFSFKGNLEFRSSNFFFGNGNCFCGLCPSLRSNEFLGGDGNHQPGFSYSCSRFENRELDLGWIWGGECHSITVFHNPLSSPLYSISFSLPSHLLSTQKGEEEAWELEGEV